MLSSFVFLVFLPEAEAKNAMHATRVQCERARAKARKREKKAAPNRPQPNGIRSQGLEAKAPAQQSCQNFLAAPIQGNQTMHRADRGGHLRLNWLSRTAAVILALLAP